MIIFINIVIVKTNKITGNKAFKFRVKLKQIQFNILFNSSPIYDKKLNLHAIPFYCDSFTFIDKIFVFAIVANHQTAIVVECR